MLLSIIIVSYNTAALTKQTIESVVADIKSSKLLKRTTEILVVDNNSNDDSVKILHALSKQGQISLILNKDNQGFSAANNQGIERSRGQFVLLLNSDTILQPGTLERLVTTFQSAQIDDMTAVLASQKNRLDRLGILSPSLLNQDGTPQPHGGSFPSLVTLATHMLMLDDLPVIGQLLPSTQHTGRRSVSESQPQAEIEALVQKDWVAGTAMMIRRAVIDEVGQLDQNIFMYGEDIEFCIRAKHHHWDVAIHPGVGVVHLGSASSSSANALVGEAKGYIYIWSKHKPLWQLPFAKLLIKLGALLRLLIFGTIKPDPKKRAAYRQILGNL